MNLTEKEAKEKYCPNFIDVHCPGTECMAWRWDESVPYRVEPMNLEEMKGSDCFECATAFSDAWRLDVDRYRCPKCRSAAVRTIEKLDALRKAVA